MKTLKNDSMKIPLLRVHGKKKILSHKQNKVKNISRAFGTHPNPFFNVFFSAKIGRSLPTLLLTS